MIVNAKSIFLAAALYTTSSQAICAKTYDYVSVNAVSNPFHPPALLLSFGSVPKDRIGSTQYLT